MLLDLCRHIRTNGLQCQGVAINGSPFCYFHDRMHKRHVPYRFIDSTGPDSLFDKMPISQALQHKNYINPEIADPNQLILFDL